MSGRRAATACLLISLRDARTHLYKALADACTRRNVWQRSGKKPRRLPRARLHRFEPSSVSWGRERGHLSTRLAGIVLTQDCWKTLTSACEPDALLTLRCRGSCVAQASTSVELGCVPRLYSGAAVCSHP
eukprot:366470-Chlamydomonas_euryale.AAC.4